MKTENQQRPQPSRVKTIVFPIVVGLLIPFVFVAGVVITVNLLSKVAPRSVPDTSEVVRWKNKYMIKHGEFEKLKASFKAQQTTVNRLAAYCQVDARTLGLMQLCTCPGTCSTWKSRTPCGHPTCEACKRLAEQDSK